MPFYTFNEFVDMELEDPLYIIEPLFIHKGVMCLHGQQTSGKSQLALGMLASIVRGERFLGKYKTMQGSVGYIQYDLPPRAWQDRHRKLKPFLYDSLFYDVVDFGYHDVNSWKQAGKWNPPHDVAQLMEKEPTVIVVDSIARCHNRDENDANTVRLVYGTFQELFPESSIVAVHHNNKDSTTGIKQNAASRARGNSAWMDNANAAIGVERLRRGKGGPLNVKLTFTKVTQGEEPKPMKVEIDPETLLLTPKELTSRDIAETLTADRPDISKSEFVRRFQEGINGVTLGKTQAYELAKEMGIE